MRIFFKTAIILAIPLLSATEAFGACTPSTAQHSPLHWSKPAAISSPGGHWRVDVRPVLSSQENDTPVSLMDCASGKRWPLFVLRRAADLNWGPSEGDLLVINQPGDGNERLLLFNAQRVSTQKRTDDEGKLDDIVRREVLKEIGKGRAAQFYMLDMLSWKGNELTLSVSGTMVKAESGPMTPYCYGVVLDTRAVRLLRVLSRKQVKTLFKQAQCREFP